MFWLDYYSKQSNFLIFREKKKASTKKLTPQNRTTLPKIRKSFYNVQISRLTLCIWLKLWLIYLIITFIKQTTMSSLLNWQITYFAVTIIILGLFLHWGGKKKKNTTKPRAYFWLLWHIDRFLMKKRENRISQYSFPDCL